MAQNPRKPRPYRPLQILYFMKKLYSLCMLFSVMGICSHSLTSCSSDDDGGGPKKTTLENEFSYNNETTRSVR